MVICSWSFRRTCQCQCEICPLCSGCWASPPFNSGCARSQLSPLTAARSWLTLSFSCSFGLWSAISCTRSGLKNPSRNNQPLHDPTTRSRKKALCFGAGLFLLVLTVLFVWVLQTVLQINVILLMTPPRGFQNL